MTKINDPLVHLKEEPEIYYHGTSHKRLKDIQRYGLCKVKSQRIFQWSENIIWASDSKSRAIYFAGSATLKDMGYSPEPTKKQSNKIRTESHKLTLPRVLIRFNKEDVLNCSKYQRAIFTDDIGIDCGTRCIKPKSAEYCLLSPLSEDVHECTTDWKRLFVEYEKLNMR